MRTLLQPFREGATSACRLLLLPAAYTGPDDFIRAGFAAAVRKRELPVDLIFADVNLQHLTDRTLLRRIRHELVLPARAVGCRAIWICGISLGGFIALAYAERYPAEVDGLCVLAPYLGNHMVTSEIERAHGVASWQPGELAPDDDERRVWRFIKNHRAHSVRVHLGFGIEDRFAASHRMMADALDPQNVRVVPGSHDWGAWTPLWEQFLDRHFDPRLERGMPYEA